MDGTENEDTPMLSGRKWQSERNGQKVSHMNKSVTISFPMTSLEPISHKKAHKEQAEQEQNKTPDYPGEVIDKLVHGGAKGWGQPAQKKPSLIMKQFTLGVINPLNKAIQQWNHFIAISCLFAIFIDPLFVHLLSTNKMDKCIVIDWPMTKAVVVFRSMTDIIYFMHVVVQFRLAFVVPESKVGGAGDLVNHPRKIASCYLYGSFLLDLFIVLPLPQIVVLVILPDFHGYLRTNYAKHIMRTALLVQYIPRVYRFLSLLAGLSPTYFILESAWASFVINLLMFVLAGHVVGSCWYFFGLQRVSRCLQDACRDSGFTQCRKFIDFYGTKSSSRIESVQRWNDWKQNVNATACFNEDGFPYGIYVKAVNLTAESSIIRRYIYSFFWGFQQISTLAGNLAPSYFEWEVLFTMGIIGLGLLLFAVLIGNMQNFLQGLGRRRLEMSLRRRDVERWMSHIHLPDHLRRKVEESEQHNWAATHGVNEENLMENMPEDLQRDIRRHLFEFLKKVEIFKEMEEPILDAIRERLRQKTYIEGGTPFYKGGIITKMVFIIRGNMQSVGENGDVVLLSEGDSCGEELLKCLDRSSVNGDTTNQRKLGNRMFSKKTVTCLTNVEAFVLQAADLEEVNTLFAGILSSDCAQCAKRNESPSEQGKAATTIQVKGGYMKQQLRHANTLNCGTTLPSKFK